MQCNAQNARTWVQFSHYIYYWKVINNEQEKKITYTLYKYDMFLNEEETVDDYVFTEIMNFDDSGYEQVPTLGMCVVFRYNSMLSEEIDKNENMEFSKEKES